MEVQIPSRAICARMQVLIDFVHNMVVVVLPACFRGLMLDYVLNFKAYIRCC